MEIIVILLLVFASFSSYCKVRREINNNEVDFSDKAKVKLSDVMNEKRRSRSESWPPDEQDKNFKLGIKLIGDNISANFDSNTKPNLQQRNPKKLEKLFWKYHLDTQWLSINKPDVLRGLMPVEQINARQELMKAVGNLNFTFVDSVGAMLEIPENMQNLFRKWLIEYSSCQMNFVWEDLGEMFWPSWIRRGLCTSSKSCSWPSGMACKHSGSRTLHLLRWVCLKDTNGTEAKKLQNFKIKLKTQKMKKQMLYYQKRRRRFPDSTRSNNLSKEVQSKKKATRITRLLSRASDGYFCQWSMLKYYINDKCSCQCK
uniref:Noggin-like protein 7 n=1 Tax=Schmidtea mediterranea TaxID=79327 RepID=C1JAC7_SCHMD|nr:noggin-like protein 7 [Schmidtea mediterranea]